MPLFLRKRNTRLVEFMDRDDCDQELLKNTYRNFRNINQFLSGWRRLFRNQITPLCADSSKTYTLLDVGFGGGDIAFYLDHLARESGINLHITAIDPDPRAFEYVSGLDSSPNINFRQATETELIDEGKVFDFVVSNHLMHHLKPDELKTLLLNCRQLTKKRLLFNDLRRSDAAWVLFNGLTLFLFRNSYIRPDGLMSIRRSYTATELNKILPPAFRAASKPPFRLLVLFDQTEKP